ncbi:MAG: hypothetical protein AUG48_08790 [Actinobacteria bacterium 13_1_20CM_3_68_9]|nr:MAG: hypothetical protein AUG48_08790 [Actinobacteria bacterium 13_1_20CM_3_68_9]
MNAITSNIGLNHVLAAGEPAGGAALDQVAIATGAALVLSAAISWLGMGHRSGKVPYLGRAANFTERVSGLPGWAALPAALALVSLLVALLGMYWDISLHIDVGRDPGPLANPAHYLILTGLFGIFSAGYFAICLPNERPGPTAVHLVGDWYAPVGGVLIAACGAFALIGFPLDDVWHRLFGQDVTLWGPTHLMLIGGASMTLVGQAVLVVEGTRARESREHATGPSLMVRARQIALMGGLLIGLSTFQGEFDFGVPQFRFVLEPVMLAAAASVALVSARLWIGRGGALGAAAFFIAVRGAIALIVHQAFGQALPHFPVYLVEAGCVELCGLVLARRPLALGAASGLAIGTIGFAAEWGWSQIAMPIAWTPNLLPEAPIGAIIAAVAGGLVGALLGCALRGDLPKARIARTVPVVALLAIVGIFVDGLWTTGPENVQAHVTLHDVRSGPQREVRATVRIDPPQAADDPAWLNVTAWQGGGLVVDKLTPEGDGLYRTTDPIPVSGDWKATIRLQQGRQILGVPVYMPKDPAIPAPKVPAKQSFTRPFVNDHQLLQREQKQGVPGWLTTVAPLCVLVLALAFLSTLAWGLGRIGRRNAELPPLSVPRRRERPLPRPSVPTGARP